MIQQRNAKQITALALTTISERWMRLSDLALLFWEQEVDKTNTLYEKVLTCPLSISQPDGKVQLQGRPSLKSSQIPLYLKHAPPKKKRKAFDDSFVLHYAEGTAQIGTLPISSHKG